MLAYQNIHATHDAAQRMRSGYRWNSSQHTRESDAVLLFTVGTKAQEDAVHNLEFLLTTGKKHGASHLILHDNKIQFLAHNADNGLEQDVLPRSWTEEFCEWLGSNRINFSVQDSGHAHCHSFRTWRHAFATHKTHGVYDLDTGTRLTNRQEIVQRMWDHGFAAWRGRPMSVADIAWSGARPELEELTAIADRHWPRRNHSNMAKKMCSAYTAINRYAAWPGAW